jgi:hypothetical protein
MIDWLKRLWAELCEDARAILAGRVPGEEG